MTKREALIQEALARLDEIERFRKSPLHAILIEPVLGELSKLKHSYEADTVAEIKYLKGKKEGLSFIIDAIERIEQDGEIAREEAGKIQRRKEIESREMDSTDL